VRADHSGDATVEPLRHGDLLARRFRVEVDDDDGRLRTRLLDQRVHDLPRRHRRVDEELAHEVDHGDAVDVRDAAARRQVAHVRRTDHAVAALEVRADAVAAVRVVAERDHVCAGGEDPVGELRGDARAVGCVLAVDDAEVHAELLAQPRQVLFDGATAGDTEDVGEKENSQFRTSSDAAGRTSTDTWFPASFV